MKTLYLVRHGQASFGSDNYDKLSKNGQNQARCLSQHWRKHAIAPVLYCSGQLERQIETAQIALSVQKNTISQHQGFNEYPFHQLFEVHQKNIQSTIDWRNVGKKEFQQVLLRLFEQDIDKILTDAGLLSWQQFGLACEQTLMKLMAEQKEHTSIAVFTSAGVIGALLQKISSLTNSQAAQKAFSLYNSSVTTLSIENEKIFISAFNNTEHLGVDTSSSLYTYL